MIVKLAPLAVAKSVAASPSFRRLVHCSLPVPHYDVVILGGGCAGLSLAMRLAALGSRCPKTLVVERRTEYANDRTWCFWGNSSARLSHLVSDSWKQIVLRCQEREIEVDCSRMPYQMIRGQAFYQEALKAIEQCGNIDLLLGSEPLTEASKSGGKWRIETSQGPCSSNFVVDTRPNRRPLPRGAVLWQSFYGQEIECQSASFDPKRPYLMDFSAGHSAGIDFTYVLPFSSTRALIEATTLGPDPLTRNDLTASLAAAIARYAQGAKFRILRAESGNLPMGSARHRSQHDSTYIAAGLTAGGARSSTGYAFQRIQRWADSCSRSLAEGKRPIGHQPDPILLRNLDRLFVSVLHSQPALGPSLFLSLFGKTDTARMIRFLSDSGTLADYAAIVSVLPPVPFVREIPKAFWRRVLTSR